MITDDLGREITHDIEVVYTAGPYTASRSTGKGEEEHVQDALRVGSELVELGFAPLIPHTSHFLHQIKARPYDVWMDLDQILLERCDAIFRMKAASKGADEEVKVATEGWSARLGRHHTRWPVYVFFTYSALVAARDAFRAQKAREFA